MDLDDLMGAWRSQEDAPLYTVDTERLHQALLLDLAALQRKLVNETRVTYGMSALMFGFMAFMVLIMVYDDDPRTWWDFVIGILGAAAFVFWGVHLYVSRTTLALRQRHLGASLRDEIERQISLLDFQIGRMWRPGGVVLTMLPVVVGGIAVILAAWRVNNEPFDWWLQGGSMLFVVVSLGFGAWNERRKAEKETLPRKRRLEALLRELDR
jgi:hypothetical protein